MLLTGIEKIENGRIFTKDEGLFECPHCKSTFAKNFAKDKMRRWGKDKQMFYTTKHCPNCDRRILMKDENKDALQHKIERLRQYANQCRITGDLEEYREALKEIANLEAEFKSLSESLPIGNKRIAARDTALKALDELKKTKDDVDKILYSRQGFVIKKDKDGDILVFIPNKPAGIYFKTFEGALKFVNSFVKDREYLSGHGTEIFQRLAEKERQEWNPETTKRRKEAFFRAREEWKRNNPNKNFTEANAYEISKKLGFDFRKLMAYSDSKDKRTIARDTALKALDELKKTKDDVFIEEYKGHKIYQEGKNKFSYINGTGNKNQFTDLKSLKENIDKEIEKVHMQHHGFDKKTKDLYTYKGEQLNEIELWNQLVKEGKTWKASNLPENKKVILLGKKYPIYERPDGGLYAVTRDSARDNALKALDSLKKAIGIKDADLPVGKHNADPDDKFNAEELAMGIKIEMEHTENEDIAKAIAKDHLNELKDYYTRLKKMEEEAIEAEKVTKDEGNFLVGKRIIVNAGRFTNAPATVIEIGGQVTHGVNGVYAKMDTGEKVWIARPDFEFKDSKTKDASQAYIDGYTAARGAYHKGTNPIKNDPAKAAEWDRGWEDGKADKDELSAKGSGQEYIKYGSHFKDKKMKDGNGEQALDKCRHSLFPVANELATIASSSIYEDRIRKAAKRAERLVDEARHVLFDAI